MTTKSILLVGCGPMAIEYAKVFKKLGITPTVVGRGSSSAEKFTAETGLKVAIGGLDAWLESSAPVPELAVVTVGEKWIGVTARMLMDRGVKRLLLEKPGGHDAQDIRQVHEKSISTGAAVYVGYNRRFYASVSAAKQIIEEDGGVPHSTSNLRSGAT